MYIRKDIHKSLLSEAKMAENANCFSWAKLFRECAWLLRKKDCENKQLRDDLDTWKSVFPDIAPESVLPDRSKIEEENKRLRTALRDAYEVFAGSDGFIPETAAEGYLLQIIKQMVDCISAALKVKP